MWSLVKVHMKKHPWYEGGWCRREVRRLSNKTKGTGYHHGYPDAVFGSLERLHRSKHQVHREPLHTHHAAAAHQVLLVNSTSSSRDTAAALCTGRSSAENSKGCRSLGLAWHDIYAVTVLLLLCVCRGRTQVDASCNLHSLGRTWFVADQVLFCGDPMSKGKKIATRRRSQNM